ncbi:MAG TPA: MFS transporter [Nocardioidaceae bacterium]|nr:MFS transporter [Nocardioidaceae bacterium]
MRAAFRTPGFKRLYAGLAASMLGDSLMLIVLSMWVKKLTDSNGAAGLTFLWLTIPALLAPLFGYVVDRVPRRAFLVAVNLGSALAMMPLLLVRDASDVWIIYTVAFLYGVSFVVVPAALNGLLKDMLAENVLVEANASLSVTREALRLVGPISGAALFALAGGAAVAMVDAASFVVAAIAVASLRVVEKHEEHEPMHWRAEVAAGVTHVRRNPLLLHSTFSLSICLLVLGFAESAIYAVVDAFDKPVEFVGPILTVQGVGALVSGLLSSRVIRRTGEPRAIALGLGLLALGVGGVAAGTEVWHLVVAVAVLGAGIPLMIVAYNTLLQRQTPSRLMGRVSTATEVLITTPQAVSIAIGALLVTLVDYRLIFTMMAVGTALAAVYLLAMLRGRLDTVAPAPREPVVVAPAATPTLTGDPGPAASAG